MIRHSFSFWQLVTLIVAVAVIVPIPPAWIGGRHNSVLRMVASEGEAYVDAARDWSADAERDLRARLDPPTRAMGYALASLATDWAALGAEMPARLGALGLAEIDLRSFLPESLLHSGAAA
jgi:hypothetical protein